MAKTKIAVLGGGAGSLSAAYYLSRTSDLQARYEITVYQMGWRLGGQGATGRNQRQHDRIEEHGLHVWMGWYENAFGMMQECIREQVKDRSNPFQSWRDAFRPHSFTPIGIDDGASQIDVTWPTNDDEPGSGGVLLSPWSAMVETIGICAEIIRILIGRMSGGSRFLHSLVSILLAVIQGLLLILEYSRPSRITGRWLRNAFNFVIGTIRSILSLFNKNRTATGLGDAILRWFEISLMLLALGIFVVGKFLLQFFSNGSARGNVMLLMRVFDTNAAIIRGLLNPKYDITKDWDLNRIDHYELREWLVENGARKSLALGHELDQEPELRALYDLAFAYDIVEFEHPVGTLIKQPNFAAGTAIRALIRIFGTYKGAVFFDLQAGMGEAMIAPMYDVLKQRGVKFEFFSKIKQLELSQDKKWIQRIHINRQVETIGDYQPLFKVKGLPCWPSEPFWEQIKNGKQIGAALAEESVTLESHWCDQSVGTAVLNLGVEFDKVVLGLGLGAFKQLNDNDVSPCAELLQASTPFREMTEKLEVIPSFGVQLWMDASLRQLGWEQPRPAEDGGEDPMDIWADMSQFIEKEAWPVRTTPRSLQFFCGTWATSLFKNSASDTDTPKQALTALSKLAEDWLKKNTATIWPLAVNPPGSKELNWSLLHADDGKQGPDRLFQQWLRPNVDPTECVVTSSVGSTQYRLTAHQSGFLNLTMAGTWCHTGMNASCVESAVMSGMAASRAICGEPKHIVGEDFLQQS